MQLQHQQQQRAAHCVSSRSQPKLQSLQRCRCTPPTQLLPQVQQQHQQQLERQTRPPQPYVPAPDAAGRARQLTADISHKHHWSQLHNCWLDNAADFGPFHLTATLCRLARLACRDGVAAADRPEVFKFSGALLAAAQAKALQLDPRGMAQCLWAYAKLQDAAPHRSTSGDAAAAALAAALLQQGRLQQLQPSQLAQAAWAAATLQGLGMQPPAGWWAAVGQGALQHMQVLKPCEAACCSWALTRNGRMLPAPLAAALQGHLTQQVGVYGPRELLQVMLALAAAQPEPTQQPDAASQQQQPHGSASTQQTAGSLLDVCYRRLHQEAPFMSAAEVSTALLACSRLGARNGPAGSSTAQGDDQLHQLPVTLSARLLKRALDTLPVSSPRVLVTLAYALARLGLNPGPWWWSQFLPYSAAALHVCSPSMLAVLAWSLAKLGVQRDEGWTQELLQHSGFKMQGFGAQESTMLLVALGKWRACPDLWWWAAFEGASQHMMPYFTAAELAGLLSGMGSTGPPPAQQQSLQQPRGVAAVPAAAAAPWRAKPQPQGAAWEQPGSVSLQQLLQLRQQEAGEQRAACADYIPGGAWTAAMLVSAQRAMSGAPGRALGGIAMGLAKLGIHPSTAWMDDFEAAVLSALPHASLQDVAAVLWGLSVMGAQPSRAVVQAVDVRIMGVLHAGHRQRPAASRAQEGQAGWIRSAAAAHAAAPSLPAAHAAQNDGSGAAEDPAGPADSAAAAHAAAAAGSPAAPEPLQQWSGLLGAAAGQQAQAAAAAGARSRPSAVVVAQLLWSVARLPQPQGVAAWADDLLTAAAPSLRLASQHTLFVLLRSLAWLRHSPGCRQWVDVWWQAYSAHLLGSMLVPPAAAAAAGFGVGAAGEAGVAGADVHANLQHAASAQPQQMQSQHPGHVQLVQEQLQPCPAAEQACKELTVVLWCFRVLHTQPSSGTGWLQAVAAFTQPLLHQLSPQRFSLLLAQLAQLHVWPGEAWLAQAEAVLAQQAQRMSQRQRQQTEVSMQMMGWLARQP